MYFTENDKQLINAWEKACVELQIEIISPFELNTESGKVKYPLLVKDFGGKKGTILANHLYFIDYPMPKHKDYFISAVNADMYSQFDRQQFIETLIDWGYFGLEENKPTWFK